MHCEWKYVAIIEDVSGRTIFEHQYHTKEAAEKAVENYIDAFSFFLPSGRVDKRYIRRVEGE